MVRLAVSNSGHVVQRGGNTSRIEVANETSPQRRSNSSRTVQSFLSGSD
jgi:hypothetical protein